MDEFTTTTGVVLRPLAFADKVIDDALGLQVLSVRVTKDGLRDLERAAAKHGMPLMAYVRKSLEVQTGIPLGLSSDIKSDVCDDDCGELDWPSIEAP